MKRRRFSTTTFTKMTLSFVLFGLFPLLILCLLFFYRYTGNVRETSIRNYTQINGYFARNVSDIMENADAAMGGLYDYQTADGSSLAAVLTDSDIAESEREQRVADALQDIMEQSKYISSVRFVDYRGNIYSRYHDQGKTLRNDASFYTDMERMAGSGMRDIKLLGTTDESNICVNSDDFVFVLTRNFMDTTTVQKAYTNALGTLFADINADVIGGLVEGMGQESGRFYVYNKKSGQYIYSQERSDYMDGGHPLAYCEEYLDGDGGYKRTGQNWIFYDRIMDSGVYAVLELDNRAIIGDFSQSRTVMILILSFSCAFLLILYMAFSNRMSMPTRRLKAAMEQAERGNLDVRVELNTNDEMEYVADGFNKMTEKLKEYIDRVYVAQICQKDAELNALKMQIQPHYLYNTLDVIRMTALTEGGEKTAELLESLARQLRYVMGGHSERVRLREELDSIREYFVITKVRYEDRFALVIDASEEDLSLVVPKLLLQPVVENAIRHGLREKDGRGTLGIHVERREDFLEIVVMDDGVGMDEESVRRMQEGLEHSETGKIDPSGSVSVGMKNVYDRIKLNCGREYGFTVSSVKGMGTIVTYRLPIWEDME